MKGKIGGMRWPYMDHVKQGQANVMISGKIFRRVTEQCWNPLLRIADMDREGVEVQVSFTQTHCELDNDTDFALRT